MPLDLCIGIGLDTGGQARFGPSSLSPVAWYDPSDQATLFQDSAGTTPVTATGQPVGKMLDKSGNGNHLTQATAASRPTYTLSGEIAWLAFDGVDDYLAGTLPIASVGGNISKTAFGAVRIAAVPAVLFDYGLAATALANFGLRADGAGGKRQTFQWAAELNSTSAWTANDEVWTGIKSGNLLSFKTDQAADGGPTDLGTGNITANTFVVGRRLDAADLLNGRLYGLIIVAGNPSPAPAITWLAAKQGRTL